jgi:uncharacterized damage-inducible protein DinB
MELKDLRTLVNSHYWARDRVLAAAALLPPEQFTRDLGNSFKSIRDTLGHLLGAELNWYLRWQGESPTSLLSPDQFPDVESLRTRWLELELKMRAYIDSVGEDGVSGIISYKLLNGTPMASPLWQMAQHVVNHGSYHRGQVTTMLRQLGAKPPKGLDMIAYYRETGG